MYDEKQVCSALNKFVQQPSNKLSGIVDTRLKELGINMALSCCHKSCQILGELMRPEMRVSSSILKQVRSIEGEWVFCRDSQLGNSKEGVWAISYKKEPASFLRSLDDVLGEGKKGSGTLLLRPGGNGWYVAIQLGLIVDYLKARKEMSWV